MTNLSKIYSGEDESASIYHKALAIIIVIALSIRIYISFFTSLAWFNTDTYDYFKMADAILSGQPYSYFPNGYPLLVAAVKSIFKSETVPTALITLNIILSTLVVGLAADITKRVTGSILLACVAAITIAIYPNQINYVRQLLTEVPTTFLLTLSIFLLLRKNYFSSGFALYLAIIFRSSILPILPILIACSLLHPKSKHTMSQGIFYLGGFVVGLAIYSLILRFNLIKPAENLSANLLISISSNSQNIDFGAAKNFTTEENLHPFRTYFMYALDNPLDYVKQRLYSLQELWGWPAAGNPTRSFVSQALIAIRIPLIIMAIFGFYKNIRNFDAWILFIPIVSLTLVHIAMFSSSRFTYPIEPFVIILATIAVKDFIKNVWKI